MITPETAQNAADNHSRQHSIYKIREEDHKTDSLGCQSRPGITYVSCERNLIMTVDEDGLNWTCQGEAEKLLYNHVQTAGICAVYNCVDKNRTVACVVSDRRAQDLGYFFQTTDLDCSVNRLWLKFCTPILFWADISKTTTVAVVHARKQADIRALKWMGKESVNKYCLREHLVHCARNKGGVLLTSDKVTKQR
jgi:hypothetical protein